MSSQISWQIRQGVAGLRAGPLAAQVHWQGPVLQVTDFTMEGTSLPELRPLSIVRSTQADSSDEMPVDCYSRGDELVATYPEPSGGVAGSQGAIWQVSWRGLVERDAAGVEWLVSLQTSQIQSELALVARSTVAAVSAWHLARLDGPQWEPIDGKAPLTDISPGHGKGVLLYRLPCRETANDSPAAKLSYVEMVSQADDLGCQVRLMRGAQPEDGSTLQCDHRLLAEELEKGVLRRVRLRGWLIPQADDFARAADLYRSYCDSQLPLTAS